MDIKQLYNDNLRKLLNEYGDVSVMSVKIYDEVLITPFGSIKPYGSTEYISKR